MLWRCVKVSKSWADIDLAAITHNAKTLHQAAKGAELCAVVKANGYGHGSEAVGRAALAGGASYLAVAQVAEGVALRTAGIDAPIIVLTEPYSSQFDLVVEAGLQPVIYSLEGVSQAESAVSRCAARDSPGALPVHLKVDTGMHRVGCSLNDALTVAQRIEASVELQMASAWTHFATGEERGGAVGDQLVRFDQVINKMYAAGISPPMLHAANTGGTMLHPASHFDLVRCGIGLYGLVPAPGLPLGDRLRPALRWSTRVSWVKRLPAGSAVSYGHRQRLGADTNLATIPVGYADGYRRCLWNRGGVVLIGGKRRPIVGVVTMDQFVVDCGDDPVAVGDEVVLIGSQGNDLVSVDEMAKWLDTINYEVVCDIGLRVQRRYSGESSF